MGWWIILWTIGGIAIFGMVVYNRLIALRQEIANSRNDIELQLKRREDLKVVPEEEGDIEIKLNSSKRYLNNIIAEYNNEIARFPASIVARIFNIEPQENHA